MTNKRRIAFLPNVEQAQRIRDLEAENRLLLQKLQEVNDRHQAYVEETQELINQIKSLQGQQWRQEQRQEGEQ